MSRCVAAYVRHRGQGNEDTTIGTHANFHSFPNALLLLFRMSTGEGWEGVMFDCSDPTLGGSKAAPVYFVSFVVVAQFVMLNLFIMIIVEDFEAADRRDKNMTPHDVAVRTPCRSLRTVVAVSDEALVCTGVQDGVEAVRPYWPQVHQVVRSVATDAAAATSTRTWQWQQVPRLHSQARRHEAEEVRRLLLAACCGGVTHMLLAPLSLIAAGVATFTSRNCWWHSTV